MKRCISLLLTLSAAAYLYSQPTVTIEVFKSGFIKPVNIKHAGDSRLFIVEQDGLIQILNSDGSVNSSPFLDIQDRVGNVGSIGDERGLLGVVFHPNYSSNGYFYVNYINNSGNTVISRFSLSAGSPDLADKDTEQELISINQPFSNHNGGDLAFGPDGYLYISSGDGGGSGDPGNRAQSLTTLLGKILRIDVNNAANGKNYAIPADNPFVGVASALDEIWALGLRNAWKFSFDRLNGDLWIGDVGQGQFEEINMVSPASVGFNFGWRCYEGNQLFNNSDCPSANSLTFPVAVIAHAGSSRCSITGGYRYRGAAYPGLSDLYFFADYCSNEIGTLQEQGGNWQLSYSDVFAGNNWVAFGEDINAELYIAGISSGTIYKIKDASLGLDSNDLSSFKMFPNPAREVLNLELNGGSVSLNLRIYDLQGKTILINKKLQGNLFSFSIANFSRGLYIVEVSDSFGNKTVKKLILN